MKKNTLRKLLCIVLAVSMLSLCACGNKPSADAETTAATGEKPVAEQKTYTAKPGSIKKTETVYINTDSSGKPLNIVVSDWLHTDKAEVAVDDISSLKDIENVKSDIEPVKNADKLVWNMDTTDLYYRGTSDKTLPVNIDITYFLNGKEIKPEEIAGKSGDVKIVIKLANNVFEEKAIEGKKVKVYNPIVVIGGMILQESRFLNASFENGRVIGDGTKEIAVMVGLPGMNETLGLDNLKLGDLGELEFSDTFTLSVKAEEFALGNMYFAALPLSSIGMDIDLPETLGELKSSLNQIKELEGIIESIDPGKLISSLVQDSGKLDSLISMVDDAVELYASNRALLELVPKYMTDDNMAAISKLFNDLQSTDVKEAIKLLNNPVVKAFLKNLPELADDMQALAPVMNELSADLQKPEVSKAVENLPETLAAISKMQEAFNDNKELMDSLGKLMSEENLDKIDGLLTAAQEGNFADKLEEYGVLAENADSLIARLSEMLKFGNSYRIYTDVSDNADSSVMFVFQTASISLPEQPQAEAQVTAPEGFFKKLFS